MSMFCKLLFNILSIDNKNHDKINGIILKLE